jgi:hypothetical protein
MTDTLTMCGDLMDRILDCGAPDGALVLATIQPGVLGMFEIAHVTNKATGEPAVAAQYNGLMGALLADGAELLIIPVGNFVVADDPEDGTPPTLTTRPPTPEELNHAEH